MLALRGDERMALVMLDGGNWFASLEISWPIGTSPLLACSRASTKEQAVVRMMGGAGTAPPRLGRALTQHKRSMRVITEGRRQLLRLYRRKMPAVFKCFTRWNMPHLQRSTVPETSPKGLITTLADFVAQHPHVGQLAG